MSASCRQYVRGANTGKLALFDAKHRELKRAGLDADVLIARIRCNVESSEYQRDEHEEN